MKSQISQKRIQSLIESLMNTLIGFGISLGVQIVLFSQMDILINFNEHIFITLVFTVTSILRGYIVRRFFNKQLVKQYENRR